MQVALDRPSASGVDIRNLSGTDTNTFQSNICLTAVNAPCPSLGTSFTASPNPIPVISSALYGRTTISWSATDVADVQVRIGSPNGPLFAIGNRGSAETGLWVPDGLTFYLQDVSGGKPLTAENTIATLTVRLERR